MTIHPQGQLALKDIAQLAGVSRPAVSNWKSRYANFPEPAENSPARRPLFEFSEVVTWLESEDFLPDDWETTATELIITSAINPLAVGSGDPASAALLALAVLAAHKRSHDSLADVWSSMAEASTHDGVFPGLKRILSELDPDLLTSEEASRLLDGVHGLPSPVLSTLVAGLSQVNEAHYGAAADSIINTFFGSGGRSSYSHYATITSPASLLLANAASTTVASGATIFDPTCGIAGTLLALHHRGTDLSLVGNDIDRTAVTIASLQTYLSDIPVTFTHNDILVTDPHPELKADTIISEPPFGIRLHKDQLSSVNVSLQSALGVTVPNHLAADAAFLAYPLQHLATEGRAYVLTNLSVCSQERLAEFRQKLVARGAVEALIQLPRKLLTYTSLATALWVLRAPGQDTENTPVLLADASDAKDAENNVAEWLHAMREGQETTIPTGSATLAEIITQNSSLMPSLLISRAPDKGEVLEDYQQSWAHLKDTARAVSDTLAAQPAPADELPTAPATLALSDIGSVTRVPSRYRKSDEERASETVPARLVPFRDRGEPAEEVSIEPGTPTVQAGDLLIPNMTSVPARVFSEIEGTWVAPAGMFVLRVTGENFLPEYLAACVNASFNAIDDGGMIPRRKLSHIQIPLLPLEEQQKFLAVTGRLQLLADQAAELHRQAEKVSNAAMDIVRYGAPTN